MLTRRQLLRIGSLSVLAGPLGAGVGRAATAAAPARQCIFLLLQGGPSHLDLWDLKPDAPAEIRGPYRPIETSVPGIRFGELMTGTANVAQHLAVVRSMTHGFNNHIAGTYITLTGADNQPNQDREAKGDDFPGPGAVLNYLRRTPSHVPVSVSLPTWLSISGPSNRMPGQYAGFLGSVYDPFLISGEPHQKEFKPLALSLPDGITPERVSARWRLLAQLDSAARRLEPAATRSQDHLRRSAYDLVTSPTVRDALNLSKEPDAVRDRYGRTKIGQSLLLARRLIEAGVTWVSYNAFNQEWDTHGGLPGRYRQIVPPMDRAFAALVEDLHQRGLLQQTLVVNTGEFGRTPLVNKDAGRDHWPDVYTTVLAGGGLRGGIVYGASDRRGAYVASQGVSPADLLATLWQQLGVAPQTEMRDRLGRPQLVSRGRVVRELVA